MSTSELIQEPWGPYVLLVQAPDSDDGWSFVRDLTESILRSPKSTGARPGWLNTSEHPTLGIEPGDPGPGDHVQLLSELGRVVHCMVPLVPPGGSNELTLGRSADNTIVLSDASVSAHHASLVIAEGGVRLLDRGSKNGTLLNGERVEPETGTWLQPMDHLDFGRIGAFVCDPRALRALLRQDLRIA